MTPASSREVVHLGARDRFVRYEVRAAQRSSGAIPVLLIPSVGGGLDLWGAFRDALAREVTTIAFEPRGFGISPAPPIWMSTRAMARDACAVLDGARVQRAHVFGISLGGLVATWLAADRPDRVERLVLASTVDRGLAFNPRGVRRALALGRSLMSARPKAALGQTILAPGASRSARRLARAAARTRPRGRRELVPFLGAALRHCATKHLGDVRAPALVLVGEQDPIVSIRDAFELGRALPDARIETIARAGHDLVAEAPEATAERVLRFFAEPG